MKKCLWILTVLMPTMIIFAACRGTTDKGGEKQSGTDIHSENYEYVDSVCPYALMHDGVMYYYTGEEIIEKEIVYTEEDVIGKVTSITDETKMPSKNGQSNMDILGAAYIKHSLAQDGLLVLMDGTWVIFEMRE